MYTPGSFLEEAVSSGNAKTVRGAIVSIIQAHPESARTRVADAIRYATEHGIDVYETEQNESLEIINDPSQWNADYYAQALTYLQANFTQKRLNHVLSVAGKLYPPTSTAAGGTAQKKAKSRPNKAAIAICIAVALAALALVLILLCR